MDRVRTRSVQRQQWRDKAVSMLVGGQSIAHIATVLGLSELTVLRHVYTAEGRHAINTLRQARDRAVAERMAERIVSEMPLYNTRSGKRSKAVRTTHTATPQDTHSVTLSVASGYDDALHPIAGSGHDSEVD
jgi:hypothetical protein